MKKYIYMTYNQNVKLFFSTFAIPDTNKENSPLVRDIMALCFVVGTEIESAFEVKGQAKIRISALREIIYEKNEIDFKSKGFDANKLHLWNVNIPGDVKNVKLKKLERRSLDINDENTIIQELGGKKLTPFEDLGDIFAYSSPKNIRIIVQPPLPATTEPHQGTMEPSCLLSFHRLLVVPFLT
jgi:hypothetical protein